MKEIVKAVFVLIIGFSLLIKGADYFVDGSACVAKKLRIPSMIIGMTIVAMGTSLPECAVSVTASMQNNNALAVSNVIGSNIFNLMVVCGACALFMPLMVQAETLKREFPFSIICAILLLLLGDRGKGLGRVDGIGMLIIFAGYLLWMICIAKKSRSILKVCEDEYINLSGWKCTVFIIGGAVAIKVGGDFVVNGATVIAENFGISQNLIGLTIVALGTSLPELVTSIVAARKHEVDMALGNVIGSNIFNILLVLGVAAVISPIEITMQNIADTILLITMSAVVWLIAWNKKKLARSEGIMMPLMYAIYMCYICIR